MILKISIARLLRLKRNLAQKHSAAEIVEILKGLQVKYNRPKSDNDGNGPNQYSMDMMDKLSRKFDKMQEEIRLQRKIIMRFLGKDTSTPDDQSNWNIDSHRKENK